MATTSGGAAVFSTTAVGAEVDGDEAGDDVDEDEVDLTEAVAVDAAEAGLAVAEGVVVGSAPSLKLAVALLVSLRGAAAGCVGGPVRDPTTSAAIASRPNVPASPVFRRILRRLMAWYLRRRGC